MINFLVFALGTGRENLFSSVRGKHVLTWWHLLRHRKRQETSNINVSTDRLIAEQMSLHTL